MKRVWDTVAHAEVFAQITTAIVDQAMATLARLKLLDEDGS